MNALFLVNEKLTEANGITKKILAQVSALEYHGLKVALCYLKSNNKNEFTGRYINGEILDKYSSLSIINKIQWRCEYKNLYRYVKEQQIKLVYIRYTHFANPFFISFLKKLKKNDVITLVELPSYPYDQEFKNANLIDKMILLIEKFSRRRFKNVVTRIVSLSDDRTIFKIPAIQISNGIDVNSIKLAQKCKPDDEIHLIGVASITYWHGYDRVIEGLHNYYRSEELNKKKVFFHIVGDTLGSESLRYKDLVKEYDLGNYVTFYGQRSGEELDALFNRADIGVGCLGCHRNE